MNAKDWYDNAKKAATQARPQSTPPEMARQRAVIAELYDKTAREDLRQALRELDDAVILGDECAALRRRILDMLREEFVAPALMLSGLPLYRAAIDVFGDEHRLKAVPALVDGGEQAQESPAPAPEPTQGTMFG